MNFYIYLKYLFQMTKKVKQKILYFLPVLIAGIFIAMALTPTTSGGQSQMQPQTTTATTVNETMPYLNTNVTWSAFNSSMTPNEYLNGTASPNYINAEPSVFYKNYISINPSLIIANHALQNDTLGSLSTTWDSYLWGSISGSATNVTVSNSWANVSNMGEEKLTTDITGTHSSVWAHMGYTINAPNYSSQNTMYDYVTAIISVSTPINSGAVGTLSLWNSSGAGAGYTPSISSGTYYISESLAQYEKNTNYSITFNTTDGKGYSSNVGPMLNLQIPSGSPDGTYSITLNGLAMTTYPISFGSNANGTTITNNAGNLQLTEFHPDISNVTIANGGYSEALSEPMSMGLNYTYTQAQITGSQFIEENTQEANLEFPTGSDISYSNSNISLILNGISGNQIGIYNINGVSYSSSVSDTHGNQTLYTGSVNPNQPNNVIIQTEYTAQQWNSITQAPFFLSVQGIEYYWWIFLIGTFGAIGIFAGLRSYSEGKEENLRAPPKVR